MAGYIGSKAVVVSSGAERKKVFTITADTTSLTGLAYTPGQVHVFHNGIRLVEYTDYVATDGSTISLLNDASAGDEVVVISHAAATISDTVSASAGGTFAGDVTFNGAFTSKGIDDNATSTAMTLDSSGNLLVGTPSGSDRLNVYQGVAGTIATLESAGAEGAYALQFKNPNGAVGNVTISGSGTTYNTTSDRRLKDNIQPIADATDKLMAMNPVSHTWIADPEAGAVVGFIAQEMQEIVPEAVSGAPDGEEMMSMDYGRITPVLVAALQEATNEIKALKERVAELEGN